MSDTEYDVNWLHKAHFAGEYLEPLRKHPLLTVAVSLVVGAIVGAKFL